MKPPVRSRFSCALVFFTTLLTVGACSTDDPGGEVGGPGELSATLAGEVEAVISASGAEVGLYYRAGKHLSNSAANFVALCERFWGL